MFISNDEAERRLNSSENVLRKINKEEDVRSGIQHEEEPPVIVPDEVLPIEDMTCASAQSAGLSPVDRILKSLIEGPRAGRSKNQINMDPAVRAAVATCAQLADTRTAAEAFGTSYHHADELKHGYTNQAARYGGEDPNEALVAEIDRQKKTIRNIAFEKLQKTLGLISDDKLNSIADPVKLGRLAKDLSQVHDKAMPKETGANLGGVHFHLWKPEMRTEESYETVTVGAQR